MEWSPIDDPASAYLRAKRAVVEHGYSDEILWQTSRPHQELTHTAFYREAAWVVLSAGMAEQVIRQKFDAIADAFYDFDVPRVNERPSRCRDEALKMFGHVRKIEAIVTIGRTLAGLSGDDLQILMRDPETFLRALPYIGPITWRHLAKNLGHQVAKHDRHLQRFADAVQVSDVDALCADIECATGDSVDVVDIVLWRYHEMLRRGCAKNCHPLGQ